MLTVNEDEINNSKRVQKAVRLWKRAHPGETLTTFEQLVDWLLYRSGAAHAYRQGILLKEMRTIIFDIGDVEADGMIEVPANTIITLRALTSRFSGLLEDNQEEDNDDSED